MDYNIGVEPFEAEEPLALIEPVPNVSENGSVNVGVLDADVVADDDGTDDDFFDGFEGS